MESGSATLEIIESIAQREAEKLQHFWVGVEHLFIALTRLEGGVTQYVLEELGHSPSYLRFAVRSEAGSGDARRGLGDFPRSPRAQKVLSRAQTLIDQGVQPDERALLIAILDDSESIPMRVLRASRISRRAMREFVHDWSGEVSVAVLPEIDESNLSLDERLSQEQRDVIQHMFRNYDSVVIERTFTSSTYSGARVFLIRPRVAEKREELPSALPHTGANARSSMRMVAPVVVKLHEKAIIRWEKKRWDEYMHDKMPMTSPSVDMPGDPPKDVHLSGLKYKLVLGDDGALPQNLSKYVLNQPPDAVNGLIYNQFYSNHKATMWGAGRLGEFPAWQEYDFLLPPALILEYRPAEAMLPTSRTLIPLDEWIWDESLHTGEIVAIRDYYYARLRPDRGTVQFIAGAGAGAANMVGRVDVYNYALGGYKFYRGEPAPKIVGKISQTRDDIIQDNVLNLEPDFDILSGRLPRRNGFPALPNPIKAYRWLLSQRLRGLFAPIHGDLHPGNILISQGDVASLIDFEWAREGHALFDWAMLEISILIDHVAPLIGEGWEAAWGALSLIHTLNLDQHPLEETPISKAMQPLYIIRKIAAELMIDAKHCAHEYYIPLALIALRVISWRRERPQKTRRFAYLMAALFTEMAERFTVRCREKAESLTDEKTDSNLYKG